MREVGVLEAKTHLSALLSDLAETGEPIGITRHGRRIARLSPEPDAPTDWAAWVDDMIRWQDEMAARNPKMLEPYDLRDDRDAIE